MKNVFKKLISRDLLEPLLVASGSIAIFQWVVAPGLSTNITLVNILSAVIGFITILFVVLYVKEFIFPSNKTNLDISEGGETELDYEPAPVKKPRKPQTKRKPAAKTEPAAKESQVTKNKK
jgi:hypothetical protein